MARALFDYVSLGCENNTSINFVNDPLLCLSGYKINGCTGDGMSGWVVTVSNETHIFHSYPTEVSGEWAVCDLSPGKYRVCEDIQPGWTNVTPRCYNITLGCTEGDPINFTNVPLLCIGGYKYDGCTGDPLGGWRIDVYNASTGDFMGYDITDGYGWWQVCGLVPDSYNVREVMQAGWKNVTDLEENVVLGCNNLTGVDFYNTPLLCITGRKTQGHQPDQQLRPASKHYHDQ